MVRQVREGGPSRLFPLLQENFTLHTPLSHSRLDGSPYLVLRMLDSVDLSRPGVRKMAGQVMFMTMMLMECDCLVGVVQVNSPVSLSSAWKMVSLYSSVASLPGPWAQPCG